MCPAILCSGTSPTTNSSRTVTPPKIVIPSFRITGFPQGKSVKATGYFFGSGILVPIGTIPFSKGLSCSPFYNFFLLYTIHAPLKFHLCAFDRVRQTTGSFLTPLIHLLHHHPLPFTTFLEDSLLFHSIEPTPDDRQWLSRRFLKTIPCAPQALLSTAQFLNVGPTPISISSTKTTRMNLALSRSHRTSPSQPK